MTDLPRSTKALLDLLPLCPAGPFLDIGSHAGAVARQMGSAFLHDDLSACQQALKSGVDPVLHADLPSGGPYSSICFDARAYDPGLAAEVVLAAAGLLTSGGVLISTARRKDLEAAFAQVEEHGEALIARQPRVAPGFGAPLTDHPHSAQSALMQSGYSLEYATHSFRIQSAAGIFSPRGLDEGTRLMLDQIGLILRPGGALLTPAPASLPPDSGSALRFLDLGSGAGVVSRVAASLWGCQVTAVDSSARALRLTRLNAPEAEVIASDGLGALAGRVFDLIASNPPYHTDFAVARRFIEGAHRQLSPEGHLVLVVRRADWYEQKIRSLFGGCRLVEEQGYTVMIAQRRERRQAPAPAPTTRKHARRVEQSRGRRPR